MKKIIVKITVATLFLVFLGGVTGVGILMYFSLSLPKISTLADYNPPLRSKILSKDGVILAEIGKENREIVQIDEVPKRIIDAFLSAEDSGFYEHTGVDYLGVMRALVANLKAGRVVQGGSTITQQVAKSLLLTRERSITRKIKDFLLAQKIEKKFTKEEILFLYLNQVYLGGGYYGVKSAIRGYFEKDLNEATVAESALVAGLLVAPGKYSPYLNPEYAKKRQSYVLGRMYANAKITKEEYEEALKEKIKYRLRKGGEFKAGYFTDWVRRSVVDVVGEKRFLNDGFIVQTTLDYDLQIAAEREVKKGVAAIDKRQGYKGVVDSLSPDKVYDFLKKQREEIYNDKSNFFVLSDENERVYEYNFDKEKFDLLLEDRVQEEKLFFSKRYKPGNKNDEEFISLLDENRIYKAVVIATDSRNRLIYASIGGAMGIIPYKYFRWAHERNISEDLKYWGYIKNPSQIVKSGDVIEVAIQSTSTSFKKEAYDYKAENFSKSKDFPVLEKQNYLQLSLEQSVDVQGALISLNPFTGGVVSLVGGSDFDKSKFNRALQSHRQPGSSFKPFLYAAGLEKGYLPNSIILDSPEALSGGDDSLNWKPRNYDNKFRGPMTFRNSLELSRNIPTIKITQDVGIQNLFGFLDRVGFKAEMPNDLSISLGSFGVTLLEMVKDYSIFPNGGKVIEPKFIESVIDRAGKEYITEIQRKSKEGEATTKQTDESLKEIAEEVAKVEEQTLKDQDADKEGDENKENIEEKEERQNPFLLSLDETQVYDSRLAYIMTNLLRGVIQNGSGRKAKSVSNFIGGKTGTTSKYVDAWFIGFSQNIVTGVWTGFDDNKTMGWGESGSKSALPIWANYMQESIKKFGEADFKTPTGIVNVYIDKDTGKPVEAGERGAFLESFVQGTEPGNSEIKGFFSEKDKKKPSDVFEEDDFYNSQ